MIRGMRLVLDALTPDGELTVSVEVDGEEVCSQRLSVLLAELLEDMAGSGLALRPADRKRIARHLRVLAASLDPVVSESLNRN